MKRLVIGAAVVVGIAAVAASVLLLGQTSTPDGPVPVSWDREVCAFCSMHVGEPGFAVQLQTVDKQVLNFDDSGCYFRYVARERPQIQAAYFHHAREDRWLSREAVRFERVDKSPMGFGLAAVEGGPIDLAGARRHCLAEDPASKHGADDHKHHHEHADPLGHEHQHAPDTAATSQPGDHPHPPGGTP